MKNVLIVLATLIGLGFAAAAMAAAGSGVGIGQVATNVTNTLTPLAKAITATCYVGGMASAGMGIMKFKAHKDNPAQVTIGAPIMLLAVGAALMTAPSVFKATGQTLFGTDATSAGPSGVAKIEFKKA